MARAVSFAHRVTLGVAVIGALVVGFDDAAVGHSEFGLMTLDAVAGPEALSADLRARVVYANDREPVSSATVMVSAVGPAGAVLPESPMTGGTDGVYTATVRLPGPGAWTFRATATTPEAAAETTFTVAVPGAPTSAPTRPADSTIDDGSGSVTGPTAANDADASGGSGWAVPAAAIAVVLVVIAAVAVVIGRRRARSG